ncbi:glycoside hydrolase domain-containing protein [Streptomyces sp. NPDC048577]|uniref:glycoside hydrolase domain-containing protein n=1 Tax=Streptomyces sp. NPDC048577 TaxID=3157209 RepID=UPI00343699D6
MFGTAAAQRVPRCAQPNLTKSWVKSVDTLGWRVIPLYVGAQPPCRKSREQGAVHRRHRSLGRGEQRHDAITKATALGMKPGSPIYLDPTVVVRPQPCRPRRSHALDIYWAVPGGSRSGSTPTALAQTPGLGTAWTSSGVVRPVRSWAPHWHNRI